MRVEFWSWVDNALDNIPAITKDSGRWRITRWGDWGCLYPKIAQNRWLKVVQRCDHRKTVEVAMDDSGTWHGDKCVNCGTTYIKHNGDIDGETDED